MPFPDRRRQLATTSVVDADGVSEAPGRPAASCGCPGPPVAPLVHLCICSCLVSRCGERSRRPRGQQQLVAACPHLLVQCLADDHDLAPTHGLAPGHESHGHAGGRHVRRHRPDLGRGERDELRHQPDADPTAHCLELREDVGRAEPDGRLGYEVVDVELVYAFQSIDEEHESVLAQLGQRRGVTVLGQVTLAGEERVVVLAQPLGEQPRRAAYRP